MKTLKIGLDIDGVIANFQLAWHELYPEISAEPNDYDSDKNIYNRITEMSHAGTLNDFYLNIKPLINPNEICFDIECYITSRPVDSEITKQWLRLHGFPNKPVFTTLMGTSKVDIAKQIDIDVFIDDYYINFNELNNAGILCYLYKYLNIVINLLVLT